MMTESNPCEICGEPVDDLENDWCPRCLNRIKHVRWGIADTFFASMAVSVLILGIVVVVNIVYN